MKLQKKIYFIKYFTSNVDFVVWTDISHLLEFCKNILNTLEPSD